MGPDDVISYCLKQFEGVVLRESWGERGIFYNPNEQLARGVYVLTVKEKDGENDRGSMHCTGHHYAPSCLYLDGVGVLNPTEKTFREFEPMIRESYEYAKEKFSKRRV